MKSPLLASLLLVHFYLDASTNKPQRTHTKKQKPSTKSVSLSTPVTLSKDNLDTTLSCNLVLVLVGSEWCSWCKKMKPVFEESYRSEKDKATYAHLSLGNSFYVHDIDPTLKTLQEHYKIEITVIPTILVFKDKKLVDQISGSQTKEQLATLIKKHSDTPVESSKKDSQHLKKAS